MNLTDFWKNLDHKRKRSLTLAVVFGSVLVIGGIGYQLRTPEAPPPAQPKVKPLVNEREMFEKSLYEENRRELGKRDAQVESLRKRLEEIEVQKDVEQQGTMPPPLPAPNTGRQGEVAVMAAGATPPLPVYPPPAPGTYYPSSSIDRIPPPPAPDQPAIEYGDISVTSSPASFGTKETDKKKESQGVYLPPSFMAATLLSGLDAPTVEDAKGNPVPVLLRVKDLAVLPNSIKADLKGCFAIAEGYGNLSTERANLRLISLSCLSRKGESVIDQKVKGFVVDQDGKIGVRGKVVAKMGSMIARSMIAGFFGGMGEALASSYTVQSTSALGTTSSVPPADIAKYGAANGVGSVFKDVSKFYLDLARQTMPVIEVGATRDLTLVIEEGITLEIRNPGEKK
jgi:conjugal transfer pilus assembly protein TraB